MAVKRGLGRGLNDLLSVSEDEAKQAKKDAKAVSKKAPAPKEKEKPAPAPKKVEDESSEVMVKVTDIEPNPNQPRTNFNEDALNELAESIKRIGVIEPIVVYKKDRGYEIIAGERRWRAARLAGVKEVPVIIRKYTKQQRVEIALIENIQRENLNPIEEAIAYNRLIEEFHLKQDEVADRVSKSRTTITNSLRLLKLCDKVKEMVVEQMISAGHARALITIEDPDVQYETAMTIFDQGLSVRDTEQLVKDVNNILATKPKDKEDTPKEDNTALLAILSQMENNLKTTLGTKVKIKPRGKNKGRIEIEYFSSDDLERIIHIINTKEQI
jgi:ParB family chromosome partitioning protein